MVLIGHAVVFQHLPDGGTGNDRAGIDADLTLAPRGGQGIEQGRLGEEAGQQEIQALPFDDHEILPKRGQDAGGQHDGRGGVGHAGERLFGAMAPIEPGGEQVRQRQEHQQRGLFLPGHPVVAEDEQQSGQPCQGRGPSPKEVRRR